MNRQVQLLWLSNPSACPAPPLSLSSTSRCRLPTTLIRRSPSRHSTLATRHFLPSRHTRHNSTRPCRRNPSAINRIHTLSVTHGGVPPCSLPILNFRLGTALFAVSTSIS